MRVTAETKEATRKTILEVTDRLLRERGWENVSTRDITAEAGIANGTLFNYFPSKEAIAGELIANALADANAAQKEGGVEEQLFTLIAAGFRRLRPYRRFVSLIIHDDDRIRREHLSEVERIAGQPLAPMLRHLYWSLYTGVVTFWVEDQSPKQEETLALLDQSVNLFMISLRTRRGKESRV